MLLVNMVAKRFEILDSLHGLTNEDMIDHASQLVEAIKTAYRVNYSGSHRQIDQYELMYVPVPRQTTGLVGFSYFPYYASAFLRFVIVEVGLVYQLLFFPCFSTDCSFFMLKFLELWNGSVVPAVLQDMMPGLKKKLIFLWLNHPQNILLNWRSLLDENMIL
jgi:hypothetical protein